MWMWMGMLGVDRDKRRSNGNSNSMSEWQGGMERPEQTDSRGVDERERGGEI
jgi:hypothetical protein